jgi:hypothetical protein
MNLRFGQNVSGVHNVCHWIVAEMSSNRYCGRCPPPFVWNMSICCTPCEASIFPFLEIRVSCCSTTVVVYLLRVRNIHINQYTKLMCLC